MRRRSHRAALVLAVGALGAAVACSFPDVQFASEDGAPETGTGDWSPLDSGIDGPLPRNPDVDPTGKDKDASGYDAATKVDAAGCTTCNCDGDPYSSRVGSCEGGPGSVYDCDDTDRGINPDIDFVDTPAWPSTTPTKTYDWNCDGVVTKQYSYNVDCNALQLGAKCSTIQGFTTDVGCGQSGSFLTCKQGFLGLGCAPGATETRKQACK